MTESLSSNHNSDVSLSSLSDPEWWSKIPFPGLTRAIEDIPEIQKDLPKKFSAWQQKQNQPFLWVVFLGGTGTGKSTIFNALCRLEVSQTSLQRPKTGGPLAFVHKDIDIAKSLPFFTGQANRMSFNSCSNPQTGSPGKFFFLEHDYDYLKHLVLVDTPDLDSLVLSNRKITEELYLLADVIIFVTSQEKYADQVPFEYLQRIQKDKKYFYLIFNKVEKSANGQIQDSYLTEFLDTLNIQDLSEASDRCLILPYAKWSPFDYLMRHSRFVRFKESFFQKFSKDKSQKILDEEKGKLQTAIQSQLSNLTTLLKEEENSAQKWAQDLESYFLASWDNLMKRQEQAFYSSSRNYIQVEIKKLFSRYDLLAKPRRFIGSIIRIPLKFLRGSSQTATTSQKVSDFDILEPAKLNPLLETVDEFNRTVLENLLPAQESSPLGQKLRDPCLALSHEEISNLLSQELQELKDWLNQRFQQLSKELPQSKKWGIYSTSIVWGLMLLSLETVVGGGISMVEAVLDSAIAPFMTKGAVDIFAYREIQKIARELAQKYQTILYSILHRQKDRYLDLLQEFRIPEGTLALFQSLQDNPLLPLSRDYNQGVR